MLPIEPGIIRSVKDYVNMLLGENLSCLIAIPAISAPSFFQAFLQHFFDNRNIVNNEYGHIVLKKPRFVFSDKSLIVNVSWE